MARVRPAADDGSRSRSLPTATMPLEHALDGRGDGELPHRSGQLPAPDQDALGADREVAADRVDARVHARNGLHQQTIAHLGQDLLAATGVPGTTIRARAPVPGALLKPARTADAVEAVPARRAE